MALIELRDVVKSYPAQRKGDAPVVAVDGVSFDVDAGTIFAIVGFSGAGKSTLVRLINGLEPATSGSLKIDGAEIVGMPEGRLRRIRRDIGMVFQQFNLFHSRDVAGNVAFPLEVSKVPKEERDGRIARALDFVGLLDRAYAYPEQLSGGQKQRVGIARALASEPRILLADEPTSALDPQTTEEVLAVLKKVNAELGITIVLITHEMSVVRSIADEVLVLQSGRTVEQGTVFDAFAHPRTEVARRFVSSVAATAPSDAELDRLRAEREGRIVAITLGDDPASQTRVFSILARGGIEFALVQGGVSEVGGRTFGSLVFELHGDANAVERVVAALDADTAVEGVR